MPTSISRAERKRAELRREIIDTAFDRFAEYGYHGTGIADIAAQLGIGHGTFYRYFKNKREIIDHVVDELIGRIADALTAENAPEAVDTIDAYRAQVSRISDALLAILIDDPRITKLLLFETTGVDEALTQRMVGMHDAMAMVTEQYLRHGVECRYLRADLDTANTARAINGMVVAVALSAARDPRGPQVAAMVDALQRLMFDGVAQR